MSYRCGVCRAKVPPGQPRRVYVVRRPNGETARELAVCAGCEDALVGGEALASLSARLGPAAFQFAPPPPPNPAARPVGWAGVLFEE